MSEAWQVDKQIAVDDVDAVVAQVTETKSAAFLQQVGISAVADGQMDPRDDIVL